MFINHLENQSYKVNTKGGLYYETTFNSNLDVFSMASRFMNSKNLSILFDAAYNENKELLAANILYLLDIREGKGERRLFKFFFHQMCLKDERLAKIILNEIPNLGRYDYIFEAYETSVWGDALKLINDQLTKDLSSEHPSLLAKWMPSLRTHNINNPFAKKFADMLHLTEKEYRKILSTLRTKINVVEKMITNKDYTMNYENIPAKAMKNYSHLFMKNDQERFSSYLEMVKKGKAEIKTKGLAPYEMIKAILFNKKNVDVINQMWANQENYFEANHENVLVVADTSGSMTSYNYLPISSALGLAIYAAERNTGVFHNSFINFSTNPTFQKLSGNTLSEMLININYNNWCGTTNIDKVISMILKATKESKEDCPSHILIISDMEFDSCTKKKTNFQDWKEKYEEEGLKLPKIIFWNVAGNCYGIPTTKNENDVALVSGFSPTIFKKIFNIEDYNPINIMFEALQPYLNMIK